MNPYEAQQLTTRLRLMRPPELAQFGELHKSDPNVFPLVFNESNFRKSMLRNQQMQQSQQGAAPPVNEQALSEMQVPTSEMPEDVGIGALPAGNMQFANGGIVAFAGGGYNEAGEAGRLEILAQEMRAAQSRLAQGDPRAQGDIDALTQEMGRMKKSAPSLARKAAAMMPIGAAQAAAPAAPASASAAPTSAPAAAPETDGGLSTLLERIMPVRGAPSRELPPLDFGAMATTIGKKLGMVRGAGSPQEAPTVPDMSAYKPRRDPGTVGPPTAGPTPAPTAPKPDLSAAEEKKMVSAAKQAASGLDVDTSGFTREDWLTLGFSLLSSKSPRFVEALGESGLKMVAGRQARMKMGQDARKTTADIAQSEAQTRYYDALAGRTDDENKPLSQMRRELAAAFLKLEANPMLSLDPAKMAAAKRQVLQETLARYPELAGTMDVDAAAGVTVPQNVKVTRIGP